MDKHRQAVQYYTRALKYLVGIEPEMTLRQLTLSIDLGESLLYIKGQREKGVHLLNTMLHAALTYSDCGTNCSPAEIRPASVNNNTATKNNETCRHIHLRPTLPPQPTHEWP